MENNRKRPFEEPSDQPNIKFSIKGQDGNSVYFEVKRNAPMQKALKRFCLKRNLEYKAVRFLYNGSKFPKRKSPESLGMVDGDEIDAFMHQSGGGFAGVGSAHHNAYNYVGCL